jgi:hypothetical protein
LTLASLEFVIIICHIVIALLGRFQAKVYQNWQCLLHFIANFSLSYFVKSDILDVAQQTYIFVAVLLPFLLVTMTPYENLSAVMPHFNSIQGIGEIKELLYGDFSLFLIFSTVVLLIALFGAAVMTRKK